MMRAPGAVAKAVSAASEAHAADAARDVLAHGNAVDAVVAGVLAAAAVSPTVWLGPVQLLVGGAGTGLLAFDGRSRQPGRGAGRPRGFLPHDPIPEAAWVAVPALPATLAAVIGSSGTWSLLRACGRAVAMAKERSPERASTLETFARRGAPALAGGWIATELLAAGGRAMRGILTGDDLATVRPGVVRCDEARLAPSGILMVPWLEDSTVDASFTHVVAAADGRGLIAIACYEAPVDGLAIPALGVVAPRSAAPVMRGQTRVTPGTPRPASAPIALRAGGGRVDLALGLAALTEAQASLAVVLAAIHRIPTVAEAIATMAAGRVVALLRTNDQARVVASA
jgi:hypothetical protein